MSQPVDLTSKFEIVSYDGKNQVGTPWTVDHVLKEGFHCSGKGKGFKLVLKTETPIYVTNVVVLGPYGCTAPIKHGAFFLSDSEDFGYGDKFKNCDNLEDFNKLCEENGVRGGFTECTDKKLLQSFVSFNPPLSGTYVHFLMISPMDDENIDVDRLGIIGYETEQENYAIYETVNDIPVELGLTRYDPLNKMFSSHEAIKKHARQIGNNPVIFMVTKKEQDVEIFKSIHVLEDFCSEGWVWVHLEWKDEESSMDKVLMKCGVEKEPEKTKLFISTRTKKYRYEEEEMKEDGISRWLSELKDGKLAESVNRGPRFENDADPNHEGLTVLNFEAFKEIALEDGSKDVFVFFRKKGRIAEIVDNGFYDLASVFKDIPEVVIATFDWDRNDVPSDVKLDFYAPNLRIFPQNKKDEGGIDLAPQEIDDLEVRAMLKFIRTHAVHKFEIDEEKMKWVESKDDGRKDRRGTLEKIYKLAHGLEEQLMFAKMDDRVAKFDGDGQVLKDHIKKMRTTVEESNEDVTIEELKKMADVDQVPENVKEVLDAIKPFYEKNKAMTEAISKIRSRAMELQEQLGQAKKGFMDEKFEGGGETIEEYIKDLKEAVPEDKEEEEEEEEEGEGEGEEKKEKKKKKKEKKLGLEELEKLADEKNIPEELKKEIDSMKLIAHKNVNKLVVKIKTKEEFLKYKTESGSKLVCCDFTATWCGPCQHLAPKFADLSLKYKDNNVVFLKIQEDEHRDLIEEEKIRAYPSIRFYKNGEQVDEVVGSSLEKIEKNIKKHTDDIEYKEEEEKKEEEEGEKEKKEEEEEEKGEKEKIEEEKED